MQQETTVTVVVSHAERRELEGAARRVGVDVSTYIRQAAITRAVEETLRAVRDAWLGLGPTEAVPNAVGETP